MVVTFLDITARAVLEMLARLSHLEPGPLGM